MKVYSSFSSLLYLTSNKNFHFKFIFCFTLIFLISCSSVKRVYDDRTSDSYDSFLVRVLVNEKPDNLSLLVKDKIYLSNESEIIAEVKNGNILNFSLDDENVKLKIAGKNFTSNVFWIESVLIIKLLFLMRKNIAVN
ncbi:MAG: hypothetical protein M5U17_12320 [Ignavibacterium sp.]|nr:hypothetical protein [Ignavibacterium sp.]